MESRLDQLDSIVTKSVQMGLGQRIAEDQELDGRTLRLDGHALINFTSCSYLLLEHDPRLKHGAIDAIQRFGTQLSSSRVWVSAPPYAELERLLGRMFDAHAVVAPSTSLGHQAALPVLVGERDALVIDHLAHTSLQVAATQLRASGVHVEIVRHSRLDLLEERVTELRRSHPQVWYVGDGVYSMFGDLAPIDELLAMLDREPQMRLYIDDAHGMSWRGKHGRGVALEHHALHPRMVLASSLNKCFASGGGVLVFPDAESARRVRTCGPPLLFSGPLQPGSLGAGVASAHVHLSPDIEIYQRELAERVAFCNELLLDSGLPLVSKQDSPIRFIACGLPRVAQRLALRLKDDGLFVNVAHFPAVPMRRAGIRFTVTRGHTQSDLEQVVDSLDRHYEAAFADVNDSPDEVWRDFEIEATGRTGPRGTAATAACTEGRAQPEALEVLRSDSIEEVGAESWDPLLGDRGSFSVAGLRLLETVFSGSGAGTDDWRFRYYRVRDARGHTIAATFFTLASWKADMLADPEVSRAAEERRVREPDFLVLRVFAMGSLLTEGDHLFVDRDHVRWREGLGALLAAVRDDARAFGAEAIALRDLPADDAELDAYLLDEGFVGTPAPTRFVASTDWETEAEFLASLGRWHRRHYKRSVEPWNELYEVEVVGKGTRALSPEEFERIHALYRNVQGRSFEINSFPFPRRLFDALADDPSWELLLLRPQDALAAASFEATGSGSESADAIAGVVASFVGARLYAPMLVGLDYTWVTNAGLYRQCLRHVVLRAKELGLPRVALGMGAPLEKRRVGGRPEERRVYLQANDHYSLDWLEQLRRVG